MRNNVNNINDMGDIINKLLEETELTKLPSLPHVLIKLLKACEKDTACFDTLADIITKDASLSAKVLAVANSPVYGKVHEFTSLKQTLLFLGLDTIKSIAITASVQQFFSRYSKEKSRFLKKFWEHTLFTALIARSLAKLTSYHNPEEAYLAGLLHDIGKLIFENYSQHEYSALIHTDISSQELLQRETEKYNITHDKIAARLLEIWGIPEVISEAIKYHHAATDEITEAHHLVKIINLSNSITTNTNTASESLFNHGYRLFDLSDAVLTDILKNAKAEVRKIAVLMEIDIGEMDSESGANTKDEEKQIQLAQEVRNIALAQGAMHLLTEDTKGIDYSAIQKSTMILFGLDRSCLFIYENDTNTLTLEHTTSQVNKIILEGLEIKGDSTSLVAEVINSKEIRAYFPDNKESNQPVVDKQIVTAFKTEGMICIPLTKAGQYLGVIAVGISHAQYTQIKEKQSLLDLYASEIASRVDAVRSGHKIREDYIKNSQTQLRTKAREIIHEVNNPLAIIRNYLRLLGERINENDPAHKDLEVISEEIDRVGSIILKCDEEFDKTGTPAKLQKINVNEMLVSMNNIMAASIYATHNIKARLNLDEHVGLIEVNINSLKQVFTNLIKNAVEAMLNKKELSIATRNINVNGKDFVEIEISDTGPGIPGEVLKNLYKPVTSTKGKLHSGLGLSIVKNLIDDMNGAITCKTGESGTVFSIHFPLKTTKE